VAFRSPMDPTPPPDFADVMEAVDHGKVVELAQFRSQQSVERIPQTQPMSDKAAARFGQRLANVSDELLEALKELDAERERGAQDAGMYHVSLSFTREEIDRIIADFVKEYAGE